MYLEHDLDTTPTDLISDLLELGIRAIRTAKATVNELRAMCDQKVPDTLLSDSGDLDEFSEPIPDLSSRKSLEEREVEEGRKWCMVSSQPAADMILCQAQMLNLRKMNKRVPVLILAPVQADFDGDGGVDETDERCGNTDEIGRATIRGAGIAGDISDETTTHDKDRLLANETKRVHGIDDGEHGIHGLVEFATLDDLEGGRKVVVLEISPDAGAIEAEDDFVNDDEDATPFCVVGQQVRRRWVEDIIKDLELIIDILNALVIMMSIAVRMKSTDKLTRTSKPVALRVTLAERSEAMLRQ